MPKSNLLTNTNNVYSPRVLNQSTALSLAATFEVVPPPEVPILPRNIEVARCDPINVAPEAEHNELSHLSAH